MILVAVVTFLGTEWSPEKISQELIPELAVHHYCEPELRAAVPREINKS